MGCVINHKKSELRKSVSKLVFDLDSKDKAQAAIAFKVSQILGSYKPSGVLSYFSFRNEPKLLLDSFSDITFYYPKIKSFQNKSMDFYSWSQGSELVENKYGIPEPSHGVPFVDNHNAVILIPGLLFDLQGNRLGYGGGYYDRFLNERNFKLKIGVCFEQKISSDLPVTSQDISMDVLVTEKRVVFF